MGRGRESRRRTKSGLRVLVEDVLEEDDVPALLGGNEAATEESESASDVEQALNSEDLGVFKPVIRSRAFL
jgi:hypothetical protein